MHVISWKTIHAACFHGDAVAVVQTLRRLPWPAIEQQAVFGGTNKKNNLYVDSYPHLPSHLISQVSMDNEKQSQVLWESITNYKTLQQVLQACPSCEQSD